MAAHGAVHAATAAQPRQDDANEAAMAAVRAHHGRLAEQLRIRTDTVLYAARTGSATPDRDSLHHWYQSELLPHIVAEERTLYSAAAELDETRLLVCAMLADHRALVGLIADLALARQAFDVATTAVAARALFTVHLSRENDLLLPALDAAGLDLAAILDGMHDLLGPAGSAGSDESAVEVDGGCGCGCAHETADAGAPPSLVQITGPPVTSAGPADPAAPGTDRELDVRVLPHGQRHEIIFTSLDTLAPGESLVIVNDHDPKPLRYQVTAMWPDRFEWTYRESGPQTWRVAITHAG